MKRKLTESEQDVTEETKKSKVDIDLGDLVASIKRKLKEEDNEVTALKEFISQAKNSFKFVESYLKTSPECNEIFHLFGADGRPAPLKLALIWEAFEMIFTVLSQQNDSNTFHSIGSFVVSKVLQNHMKLLYSSLNANASNQLIKSALTCMTLMLAQGVNNVKEFLGSFDFSLKCFKVIAKKRDRKQKPDPRTCFVRFCLAFFAFGDVSVIKKILEEKGLGLLILTDLHLDSTETIIAVLETLLNKVIDEPNLLKKTKLLFFNPLVLSKLTILCKNKDENIRNLILQTLAKLCTDMKYGICFAPGVNDKLVNPVLLKFLLSTKQQAQQEEEMFQVTTKTLKTCYDITIPYLNGLNLQLEPRNSEVWFANMDFVTKLLKNVSLTDVLSSSSKKDVLVKHAVPNLMTKMQFTTGLKSKVMKVQQYTLDLLQIVLSRCVDVKTCLLSHSTINDKIDEFMSGVVYLLPDVKSVIAIRQIIFSKKRAGEQKMEEDEQEDVPCEEKSENKLATFTSCVRCLHLYQVLKPGVLTESGYNICKLLLFEDTACNEDVLELSLDILLQEQTGIRSWVEKKLSSTDNIIQLVLSIMMSWKNNIRITEKSQKLFYKILNATGQYDDYDCEVNLWLNSLISSTESDDVDTKALCKQFADCCVKILSEPFLYSQEIYNIMEETDDSYREEQYRLPFSPLLVAFVKLVKSEEQIKQIVLPVLGKVFVCLQKPQLLTQLLRKQIDEAAHGCYTEFFSFCDVWLKGIGVLNTGRLKSKKTLYTFPSNKKDVMEKITEKMMSLILSKDSKVTSSSLKDISLLMKDSPSFLSSIKSFSMKAFVMFLCNALHILYNNNIVNNLQSLLTTVTDQFGHILQSCLQYSNESTSEIVDIILKLPWIHEPHSSSTPLWKSFAESMHVMCLRNLKDASRGAVYQDILHLYLNGVCKNEEVVHDSLLFLQKVVNYLDKETNEHVAQTLISNLLTERTSRNNVYLDALCTVLDKIDQTCPDEVTIDIEENILDDFLIQAIESEAETMLKTFAVVLRFYTKKIDLNESHYTKLLQHKCTISSSVAVLLCKKNENYVDVFIDAVLNGEISASNVTVYLLPLVLYVLKTHRMHKRFEMFGEALVNQCWDELVKAFRNIRNSGDLKSILKLLLPFATLEKICFALEELSDCLISISSPKIANTLEFCSTAVMTLNDEKTRSLLACKILAGLMSICVTHVDGDLHQCCLDHIKVFVKMLHGVKLKSKTLEALVPKWNEFVKFVLKNKFKNGNSMTTLCVSMECLYLKKKFIKLNCLKMGGIYEMVISHSEFFEVFFSETEGETPEKVSLVQLLASIVKMYPDVCNQSFVPVLMVAYKATLSQSDLQIFSILRQYENNGVQLSKYYPLTWGSNAYEIYKQRNTANYNLLKEQAWNELLSNLDAKRMIKSAVQFPINLSMDDDKCAALESDLYDPRFFLPLFVTLLQPGYTIDCRQFVATGCLSLTLSCLSSHDVLLRKMAYHVISLYNEQVEVSRFREKNQITYFLMVLKNSVCEEYMRWTSIWCAFFIRYLHFLLRPDQHLYSIISNCIIQKPVMNVKELPVFLPLFNSSSLEHTLERGWVLRLLADGFKDQTDYYLYKKYHVFELLMAFYDSNLSDKNNKCVILELLTIACRITHAAYDLVKTHSILTWLHRGCSSTLGGNRLSFIALLSTLFDTFNCGESDRGVPSNEKILDENANKTVSEIEMDIDIVKSKMDAEITDVEPRVKGTVSIPRMFAHEAFIVGCHVLRKKNLKRKEKVVICSVLAKAISTRSYFGELRTWLHNGDIELILATLRDLVLEENHENDDINCIENTFKIFVLLSKRIKPTRDIFSQKQWKKFGRVAREKGFVKTLDAFDMMQT